MPKSWANQPRETRTLNAKWWSGETTASGQFVERVEVKYPMLELDSQWISARAQEEGGKRAKASGSTKEQLLARAGGSLETYRMFTCIRMVTCFTNEHGVNTLPPSNAPLDQHMAFWRGVPEADIKFIQEEIDALNETNPAPILPEDVVEAEANAQNPRTADDDHKTSAALVAEGHFRSFDEEPPAR